MNEFVLHSVSGLSPEGGGPSQTVTNLTDHLSNQSEFDIGLISQSRTSGKIVRCSENSTVLRNIAYSNYDMSLSLGLPHKKALAFSVVERKPKILHQHGIWHPASRSAASISRANAIPLVIHPRGMLEPWALKFKAWKKRLAMKLYQNEDLLSARLFFATSEQEMLSIRSLGYTQPVAVIPNGVFQLDTLLSDSNYHRIQWKSEKNKIVFMSRLHPKKGLELLLEAWNLAHHPDWLLQIAGPDESGYTKKLQNLICKYDLNDSVELIGEVSGKSKSDLLGNARIFILPSYSENFGVVVAEALSFGVPVITTTGTPWDSLRDRDCGWWVDPNVQSLTSAIRAAISMEDSEIDEMRCRAQRLAGEFDWVQIANDTADVYRWILGHAERPTCVHLR
ncbi:MAG: glycosyltransferase [Hyphomicrobiales bacterium]